MRFARRFFSRWQNWAGLILILGYIGVAIAAPYLSPDDPAQPGAFMRVGKATRGEPQPPGEQAILGMLPFGIDVYHALVWGSRDALQFGLIVTVTTALFGTLYGAVSGFAGNRTGTFMLRIADSFLAFPPIAGVVFLQQLFAVTITAMGGFYFRSPSYGQVIEIAGPMTAIQYLLEHINPLMLSLIVFSWMPYARLVHSIVLTLKQTEFVQAARALGGSPAWIIRKHILRNSTGPAIVLAARDVGGVVLLQATFTFIQIGGGSVWGQMLSQGRDWIIGPGGSLLRYWWAFVPPTLAVMVFGIAWNMLGDGLNDALEPTTQGAVRGRSLWNRLRRKDKAEAPPSAEMPPPVPASTAGGGRSMATVAGASSSDGADPVLRAAREAERGGDLEAALRSYNHLIRRDRLVDEILPDLARLAQKFPRDPQVWQTLGDALERLGDPRHAAQSYEQARQLSERETTSEDLEL